MRVYSQKNEQAVLLAEIEEGRLPKVGRFLDIGAYDGETYSNTCALIELGWSGIMVEPGLRAFWNLFHKHGGNDKVVLVHAAVAPFEKSFTQFFENGTYSTTETHNRFEKFAHTGSWSGPFYVWQVGLQRLMRDIPGLAWGTDACQFDVVSIDTEGTSSDIFRALPLYLLPTVVIVEHDQRQQELSRLARARGYELISDNEENLIFRRTNAL
jgi:hypothetical protein